MSEDTKNDKPSRVVELRAEIDGPIYNRILKCHVGQGELEYETYLSTQTLLSLQYPSDQRCLHEELLFQIVHQAQELWMKALCHDGVELVGELDADSLWPVSARIERMRRLIGALANEMSILDTLTPAQFGIIRRSLGTGSGQESPGYNRLISVIGPEIESALKRLLERRKVTLMDIYCEGSSEVELQRICEQLVDFDELYQGWLVAHFHLVRRTIGVDRNVQALDGFPTHALAARMLHPLFPSLWDVRVQYTKTWRPEGGWPVGADRTKPPPEGPFPRAIDLNDRSRKEAPPRRGGHHRGKFPILAECVYLNSNSTGAFPRAMERILTEYWSTLRRWRDDVWEGWWRALHEYADDIARLIAAPQGSVWTDTNLSTLLGRLATCFDYRGARRRVVVTDREFPTVPFIWRAFERVGAEIVVVPLSGRGDGEDEAALAAAIDERTLLACITHASYTTGTLLELEPVVRRAHQVGALLAVDAYQSVGAVPIDVEALGVDFLLAGAHKWLCGSTESGFLYVRPSLLPTLEPLATGWVASTDPLSFRKATEYATSARRFASGTPSVLPALLSRPGMAYLAELGMAAVRALSLEHTQRIMDRADEAGLEVVTPRKPQHRGGSVGLRFPGDAEVCSELVGRGFVCSHRGVLRVAPHYYNTDDEVDRFMDALVSLARKVTP